MIEMVKCCNYDQCVSHRITPKHVYSLNDSQSTEEIVDNIASILAIDSTELGDELTKQDESYIQIAKDATRTS